MSAMEHSPTDQINELLDMQGPPTLGGNFDEDDNRKLHFNYAGFDQHQQQPQPSAFNPIQQQ